MQAALSKIYETAQKIKRLNVPSRLYQNDFSPPIPSLRLLTPDEILNRYQDRGLPKSCLERSAQKLADLRDLTSQQYLSACRSLARVDDTNVNNLHIEELISRLRSIYEKTFNDNAVSYIRRVIQTLEKKYPPSPHTNKRAARSSFNHEYTPLLERYFELNPYPSSNDKAHLSKKSKMSVRQIEVWFQNHRNRARKEGRTLHRLINPSPLVPVSESRDINIIQESDNSSDAESYSFDEEHEVTCYDPRGEENREIDFIHEYRPSYAFPTPYTSKRPSIFENPSRTSFQAPNWWRRPSVSVSKSVDIDVNELTTLLATKLSIREKKAAKRGKLNMTSDSRPWFTATTIFIPRAPHPSLVRPTHAVARAIRNSQCDTSQSHPSFGVSTPLAYKSRRSNYRASSSSSGNSSSEDWSSADDLSTPPPTPCLLSCSLGKGDNLGTLDAKTYPILVSAPHSDHLGEFNICS